LSPVRAVIVQARMGSERLPGKVLEPLADKPLLWHVLERTRRYRFCDIILVATTSSPDDDVLEREVRSWGFPVYRGARDDVLDRFYRAAAAVGADLVYRVNGDNPLADPRLADRLFRSYARSPVDYLWVGGAPLGVGAELTTFAALRLARENAGSRPEREHVTLYLREGGAVTVRKVPVPRDYPLPVGLRLTVDTPADLELMRCVYGELYRPGEIVDVGKVAGLFASRPELAAVNAGVTQRL